MGCVTLASAVLWPVRGVAEIKEPSALAWDTELVLMDLEVKGATLPLGPEWSPVVADVHIGLGSTPSVGKAFAYGPLEGSLYRVESFFDVYFDITITDADPTLDLPGGQAELRFLNNGPAYLYNQSWKELNPELPNYGLIPLPLDAPYIGETRLEIPLGVSAGGDPTENDKIKLLLAQLVMLTDGTSGDLGISRVVLEGAVEDQSADPPFGLTLTGPTTGTAKLVPEPNAYALAVGCGLLGFGLWRRLRCRSAGLI